MLQEVNNYLDPRIGYDEAIRLNLERILHFYEAKTCILVLKRPGLPPTYRTYFVSHPSHDQTTKGSATLATSTLNTVNQNSINEDEAKKLLTLPNEFSARFELSPTWWQKYLPGYTPPEPSLTKELSSLAKILDTRSFLTAPYTQQDGSSGRIFITPLKRTFAQSDVEFVSQLMISISHIVESMQLMDELASESAKHERFRISLDIHDTTIQPYIGLKLGLDALNRQAGSANPLSKDISELLNMTESTIRDLRRYVTNLREDKVLAGDSLITSIKEQAERFKRFYKINVTVKCDSAIRVNSRLAGDVVQIFAEGLSNILRHTKTRNAYLSINCDNQNLMLEIANETPDKTNSKLDFIPRSINARALSLGGTSCVKSDAEGYTVVYISIPI
jgi:signal transduction histidine kinase